MRSPNSFRIAELTREVDERAGACRQATSMCVRVSFALAVATGIGTALSARYFEATFWFYAGVITALVAALTLAQSELRQKLERREIARLAHELEAMRAGNSRDSEDNGIDRPLQQ